MIRDVFLFLRRTLADLSQLVHNRLKGVFPVFMMFWTYYTLHTYSKQISWRNTLLCVRVCVCVCVCGCRLWLWPYATHSSALHI